MKKLILKIIPLLFVIIWPGYVFSQTINTTAGSLTSCPGEILVSIDVTDCNNVGAISLMLTYNSSLLTYLGYQDVHGDLSSGLLIVNSTGTKVVISWASSTPANVGNGTLLKLRFSAITGSASLNWDTQTPGNCEYSDNLGNILPSSYTNGTATIQQPPVISVQPVDKTVLVGQNTSFSLTASATGLTYRWQRSIDGGSNWADLNNVTPYSGVTSNTLAISNVQLSMSGHMFRCRLEGTCGPTAYSDEVVLTVIYPVTTTLPTTSICPGSLIVPVSVTNFSSVGAFSLVFSYSTSVLTYTGYQSLNTALSGGLFTANASGGKVYLSWSSSTPVTFGDGTIVELLFSMTTGTSNLTWDTQTPGNCEYSGPTGSLITSVFVNGVITGYGLPAITVHPQNKSIPKGQNTTFSVTATGSGLTYRWQASIDGGTEWNDLSNGGNYSGVTNATLNIIAATAGMNGYLYRCRVSGTCPPQVYSNSALLSVFPNVITSCPSLNSCPVQVVVPISVTDFSSIGSFSMVMGYNSATITYTGYQNIHNNLSGGTTVINTTSDKVYFTWYSTSGATIPVGGILIEFLFTGISGSCSLSWDTQTPGNCEYSTTDGQVVFSTWINGSVNIYQPPVINTHPVNKTIYSGGSTTFSVTASGTGLWYQWEESTDGGLSYSPLFNTPPYSGVFAGTLTIQPASQGMSGNLYRCHVFGTCTPHPYSNPAQLTVTQLPVYTSALSITSTCTGNIDIPIYVINCNNVGSISLVLEFDTTKLLFDGYHSVNNELTAGYLVVNRDLNKIYLSWASTNPADIGSGYLLTYRFKADAGIDTYLNWDTQTPGNCEYSNAYGMVITSFYTNSHVVVPANAMIVTAGEDQEIAPGGSVQLNGSASGGNAPYEYSWTPVEGLSDPTIATPIASPTVTTTYTLTVTDFEHCVATDQVVVTVLSAQKLFNLTLWLEGLWNGSAMNEASDEMGPHWGAGIADHLEVELHHATSPFGVVWSQSDAELATDGSVAVEVPVIHNGSYYVVIRPRNSIETWSASPVSFAPSVISYNFTTSADRAYGDNLQMLAPGIYGIFGGDANQDGVVDSNDLGDVDNDSNNFMMGYIPTDLNGDGIVDSNDLGLCDNNANNFVMVITP